MLKRDQRTLLILELYKKGCRIQRIQQALQIPRRTILRAIHDNHVDLDLKNLPRRR